VSIADPTREVLDTLCSGTYSTLLPRSYEQRSLSISLDLSHTHPTPAFRVHPISEEVLTKPEEATERVARFGSYLHLTLCERTRVRCHRSAPMRMLRPLAAPMCSV